MSLRATVPPPPLSLSSFAILHRPEKPRAEEAAGRRSQELEKRGRLQIASFLARNPKTSENPEEGQGTRERSREKGR